MNPELQSLQVSYKSVTVEEQDGVARKGVDTLKTIEIFVEIGLGDL